MGDDDSILIGLGCVYMSYDAYDCSSAWVAVGFRVCVYELLGL